MWLFQSGSHFSWWPNQYVWDKKKKLGNFRVVRRPGVSRHVLKTIPPTGWSRRKRNKESPLRLMSKSLFPVWQETATHNAGAEKGPFGFQLCLQNLNLVKCLRRLLTVWPGWSCFNCNSWIKSSDWVSASSIQYVKYKHNDKPFQIYHELDRFNLKGCSSIVTWFLSNCHRQQQQEPHALRISWW